MKHHDCPFCRIVAGTAPATVVRRWPDALAILPRTGGAAPGHTLIIPTAHVADVGADAAVTAAVMARAAELAAELPAANVITSKGTEATQSVFHLHVHVVPRADDDGLPLPWTAQQTERAHQAAIEAAARQPHWTLAEVPGNIRLVCAREPIPTGPSVFLAGPTPDKAAPVPSWRPEAIAELAAQWSGAEPLIVLCPESRGRVRAEKYEDQVDWETTARAKASAVLFWIPRDMKTLPGMTTNVEWGLDVTTGRAVLGIPPTCPDPERNRYLAYVARRHGAPVAESLPEAVAAALALIETFVPTFRLMHTPETAHNWEREEKGVFADLLAAMAAAGHPDPTHWQTAVGAPDCLFIDWIHCMDNVGDKPLPWMIQAPGVAEAYTDLLTRSVTGDNASDGGHCGRLGPQAAALHAAAADAERLLRGHGEAALRFAAAVDADWRAIEAAEKRASAALEADGLSAYAVYDLGACVWGFAALALAARHLIGRTPGWSQADYDTLTRPWAAAIGPLHPADTTRPAPVADPTGIPDTAERRAAALDALACSAVLHAPRLLRRSRLHTCTLPAGHGRDHLDEESGHAWQGGIVLVPPRPAWQRSLHRAAHRLTLWHVRLLLAAVLIAIAAAIVISAH